MIDWSIGYGYIPVIMPTKRKRTTMAPRVFEKPQSIVNVQLRYKERDKDGKLVSKGQKAFSVVNVTLDQLYQRLMEALGRKE